MKPSGYKKFIKRLFEPTGSKAALRKKSMGLHLQTIRLFKEMQTVELNYPELPGYNQTHLLAKERYRQLETKRNKLIEQRNKIILKLRGIK